MKLTLAHAAHLASVREADRAAAAAASSSGDDDDDDADAAADDLGGDTRPRSGASASYSEGSATGGPPSFRGRRRLARSSDSDRRSAVQASSSESSEGETAVQRRGASVSESESSASEGESDSSSGFRGGDGSSSAGSSSSTEQQLDALEDAVLKVQFSAEFEAAHEGSSISRQSMGALIDMLDGAVPRTYYDALKSHLQGHPADAQFLRAPLIHELEAMLQYRRGGGYGTCTGAAAEAELNGLLASVAPVADADEATPSIESSLELQAQPSAPAAKHRKKAGAWLVGRRVLVRWNGDEDFIGHPVFHGGEVTRWDLSDNTVEVYYDDHEKHWHNFEEQEWRLQESDANSDDDDVDENGLSAYERQRAANINELSQFLESQGLGPHDHVSMSSSTAAGASKKSPSADRQPSKQPAAVESRMASAAALARLPPEWNLRRTSLKGRAPGAWLMWGPVSIFWADEDLWYDGMVVDWRDDAQHAGVVYYEMAELHYHDLTEWAWKVLPKPQLKPTPKVPHVGDWLVGHSLRIARPGQVSAVGRVLFWDRTEAMPLVWYAGEGSARYEELYDADWAVAEESTVPRPVMAAAIPVTEPRPCAPAAQRLSPRRGKEPSEQVTEAPYVYGDRVLSGRLRKDEMIALIKEAIGTSTRDPKMLKRSEFLSVLARLRPKEFANLSRDDAQRLAQRISNTIEASRWQFVPHQVPPPPEKRSGRGQYWGLAPPGAEMLRKVKADKAAATIDPSSDDAAEADSEETDAEEVDELLQSAAMDKAKYETEATSRKRHGKAHEHEEDPSWSEDESSSDDETFDPLEDKPPPRKQPRKAGRKPPPPPPPPLPPLPFPSPTLFKGIQALKAFCEQLKEHDPEGTGKVTGRQLKFASALLKGGLSTTLYEQLRGWVDGLDDTAMHDYEDAVEELKQALKQHSPRNKQVPSPAQARMPGTANRRLDTLAVPVLRQELRARGLPTHGDRGELVARINKFRMMMRRMVTNPVATAANAASAAAAGSGDAAARSKIAEVTDRVRQQVAELDPDSTGEIEVGDFRHILEPLEWVLAPQLWAELQEGIEDYDSNTLYEYGPALRKICLLNPRQRHTRVAQPVRQPARVTAVIQIIDSDDEGSARSAEVRGSGSEPESLPELVPVDAPRETIPFTPWVADASDASKQQFREWLTHCKPRWRDQRVQRRLASLNAQRTIAGEDFDGWLARMKLLWRTQRTRRAAARLSAGGAGRPKRPHSDGGGTPASTPEDSHAACAKRPALPENGE